MAKMIAAESVLNKQINLMWSIMWRFHFITEIVILEILYSVTAFCFFRPTQTKNNEKRNPRKGLFREVFQSINVL